MRIAIAGPIAVRGLSKFLDCAIESLPAGNEGAPLLNTLIISLIRKGYEVSAYTLDANISNNNESVFTARGSGGLRVYVGSYRRHSFRPNNGKPGRMLDMFQYERQALVRMINQDKPDLIHAHWTYEYALAAIKSGLPYVVTAHDSPYAVLRYMPNLYRLGRLFMARRVLISANSMTAVSPYLKGQIQRYAVSPISVIGNPVPYHVQEKAKRNRLHRRDPTKPRVAMVLNGWGKLKNPAAALRAFGLFRRKFPEAQLLCFGADYGEGGRAQQWAQTHGLAGGVEFIGALPHHDLLDSLAKMDVLLHPSLEESCPLTLLEAMAMGTAVIGGDRSGGVPWILDNGQAGTLCDIRSPAAMCQAMSHLLTNCDVYEKKVKAAIDRVNTLFTPDTVISQYEKIYRQTLSAYSNK